MFIPKLYRQEDREEILNFLQKNNFPALVTFDGTKPIATHAPVEVVETPEGGLIVYGHMSRANPQWKTFGAGESMLIFQGAHTYISPRWYNHVNVPTWNYMIIHLYGAVRALEGDEFKSLLSRLVERHESTSGYRLESLPPEFVEKEIKGAIGFAMDVVRIDAGYKLSQNRNDEDHANIIHQLEGRADSDSHAVARAMKQNRG